MHDEYPKAMHKHGGPEQIHGSNFHVKAVHNVDEEFKALEEGWFRTTTEALAGAGSVGKLKKKKEENKPDDWGL